MALLTNPKYPRHYDSHSSLSSSVCFLALSIQESTKFCLSIAGIPSLSGKGAALFCSINRFLHAYCDQDISAECLLEQRGGRVGSCYAFFWFGAVDSPLLRRCCCWPFLVFWCDFSFFLVVGADIYTNLLSPISTSVCLFLCFWLFCCG